jgi:NAD(P)-dependent dehydrogenase (short-subunit alcohol dehydrogenase family)
VIVNVIGIGDRTRNPDYVCGATGNAALAAFTQSLGHAGVRDGIRVLGVSPGPVETERMVYVSRSRAQQTLGDAERWRELAASWPFKRAASTREIAVAIAFLCSPLSGYTSGTILPIDGGVSAR